MYSGMISTHSTSRKVHRRDSPSSIICRQTQGQHIKLINQSIIESKDKAMHSLPRRLISYIREAWTGIISGEEGKNIQD
jgi:hypothetical protein